MKRLMMTLAMIFTLALPAIAFADSKAESQAKVRQQAEEVLAELYKVQPSARKATAAAKLGAKYYKDADLN